MSIRTSSLALLILACMTVSPSWAEEKAPDAVTALVASMTALREYEWIETTAISLKGEEKSKSQKQCYYGADGKVQKVAVGEAPEGKSPRGLRGKAVENKKEEIKGAAQAAAALIGDYMPLDPALIESALDNGKLSVRPADKTGRAGLDIKDYLKAGDQVTIELDANTNKLLKYAVSSYVETKEKPVSMTVDFATLEDGTIYPAKNTLDLTAESVVITTVNSGYKKK